MCCVHCAMCVDGSDGDGNGAVCVSYNTALTDSKPAINGKELKKKRKNFQGKQTRQRPIVKW